MRYISQDKTNGEYEVIDTKTHRVVVTDIKKTEADALARALNDVSVS